MAKKDKKIERIFTISPSVDDTLNELARVYGKSRSQIVRDAVAAYKAQRYNPLTKKYSRDDK